MSTWGILLLALGLALDAVAVSAARGLAAPRVTPADAGRVAVVFGGMQALMPVGGWALGEGLGDTIASFDHWIAFGILLVLGVKMIVEAVRADGDGDGAVSFGWRALWPLGVATSIDAMAAGITLPILGAPLVPSIVAIGLVTAALSAAAVLAGRRLGAHASGRLDLLGGLVLIGIGTKILVEHLGQVA